MSTQRLADYLRDVRESGDISNDTGELAWTAWRILWEGMAKRLPVPDAAAGPNGELLYAWNEGEHHLELEIFPNAPAEFFYRNRSTGKLWERPYRVGDPVSMEVREHLSLFS